MPNILTMKRWSPYAVGAGIGVLSWITFYFMNKALGTSTAFVGLACSAVGGVAPDHAAQNAYCMKEYFDTKSGAWKPVFDWQMALDLALIAGAMFSALISRSFKPESVPSLWRERFGPSVAKRFAFAFLGGFILLFGARMAGGCTSGHGISGSLQFAASSWIFFLSMFASGVMTAMLLFQPWRSLVPSSRPRA